MNNQIKPVSVTILDKEYRIACKPGEEEDVVTSARHLDKRMREIRKGGKVLGTERIAVMAALNLAYELISQTSVLQETSNTTGQRLRTLSHKMENALQSLEDDRWITDWSRTDTGSVSPNLKENNIGAGKNMIILGQSDIKISRP